MSSKEQNNGDVENKLRLTSPNIYEIISAEGREELSRPFQSLAWSALVAGICISFSLFCEGFIKLHMPESGNYFLLENIGYTVGFLIVIIGRFQLFTENTVTVILPMLDRFSLSKLTCTMKLWAIVLSFNMLGTFLVAILISYFSFFSPAQMEAFIEVSKHAVDRDLDMILLQAIPAGFLIAALVWMLPSAGGSKFWVILLMTYIIAVGDFAHIVAGSVEAFLLIFASQISIAQGIGYLVMACLGNIIGGTGLFALMAYAQVREEM
jgi:formate/nitrite transporter FocA (FNT family)